MLIVKADLLRKHALSERHEMIQIKKAKVLLISCFITQLVAYAILSKHVHH